MADPISAEPQNWETDIILKVSMPGKQLRDGTLQKMQKAEQRHQSIQSRMQQSNTQANLQTTYVEEKRAEAVQTHLNGSSQPVYTQEPAPVMPAQQVSTAPVEIQSVAEPNHTVPVAEAPVVKPVEQPAAQVPVVEEKPQEIDILSRLATGGKTAEQEWKQEMVRKTADDAPKRPIIDPKIIIAERRPEEKRPEFYTNYPGLEMKEKYKVWTIEPTKEEAPTVIPSNSVNISKVENVANKIIGGDWVLDRLKKR